MRILNQSMSLFAVMCLAGAALQVAAQTLPMPKNKWAIAHYTDQTHGLGICAIRELSDQ